jgi:hypothetical protein
VSGSGNSLRNHWIPSKVDAPYLCCAAWDGAATNLALVVPAIKARYKDLIRCDLYSSLEN